MEALASPPLLQAILDAIPSLLFVVDPEVRIVQCNQAALRFAGGDPAAWLERQTGDVLRCLNSFDHPDGCGHGFACASCPVRQSVAEALSGVPITRRRVRLDLFLGREAREIYALITTSSFVHEGRTLVLLVVEDISEMIQLRHVLPVCCVCRQVQAEDYSWMALESYFKEYWDVDFSHGYCPDCLKHARADLG